MKYLEKFLVFTAFTIMTVISTLWEGWVVSVLWGWFMVPVFGLPPLGVPAAIGVALVAGFLTYQVNLPDDLEKAAEAPVEDTVMRMVLACIAKIAMGMTFLAFGFVVRNHL